VAKPTPLTFEPLENGLDYMESVVRHLSDKPTSADLKYAVLHLAAAIEVLVKARLSREHWTLILSSVDKTSAEKFKTGDFMSVSALTAMERLVNVAGVAFEADDLAAVRNIVEKRNRLQHHGLQDTVQAVQAAAARALDFLITFVEAELRPEDETDLVDESLNRIRSQLTSIRKLVIVRSDRIAPKLKKLHPVLRCPSCEQWGLELAGDLTHCHFCTEDDFAEITAERYVHTILRTTRYRADKDGDEYPLYDCPDCGAEALVAGALVMGDEDQSGSPCDYSRIHWVCFAEGSTWQFPELVPCGRCEAIVDISATGSALCTSCGSD
jgi:hypothetical protein